MTHDSLVPPPASVFFAHPKDEPELDALTLKLHAALSAGGARIDITTGEASFNTGFRYYGGWPQWIDHVIKTYPIIVVGPRPEAIGQGTAQIVKRALANGNQVYAWNGTAFHKVQAVYRNSTSNDMKSMYYLG